MVTSVPNLVKMTQIAAELWTLSFFKNGGRPPSWILLHVKNDVTARCGLSISNTTQNLVTIAQTAAELLRFSFVQNGGPRHLGFCCILFSDHPRSLTDGLKLCLKFYVDPIYTFEDIAISIFENLA